MVSINTIEWKSGNSFSSWLDSKCIVGRLSLVFSTFIFSIQESPNLQHRGGAHSRWVTFPVDDWTQTQRLSLIPWFCSEHCGWFCNPVSFVPTDLQGSTSILNVYLCSGSVPWPGEGLGNKLGCCPCHMAFTYGTHCVWRKQYARKLTVCGKQHAHHLLRLLCSAEDTFPRLKKSHLKKKGNSRPHFSINQKQRGRGVCWYFLSFNSLCVTPFLPAMTQSCW